MPMTQTRYHSKLSQSATSRFTTPPSTANRIKQPIDIKSTYKPQPFFREFPASSPAFKQDESTSDSGSQSSAPTGTVIRSTSTQSGKHTAPALSLSSSAFPTLPSAPPRDKPTINGNQVLQSLRAAPPVTSAWSSPQQNANAEDSSVTNNDTSNAQSGKSKKKKGKERQMLFTLGSFPT